MLYFFPIFSINFINIEKYCTVFLFFTIFLMIYLITVNVKFMQESVKEVADIRQIYNYLKT